MDGNYGDSFSLIRKPPTEAPTPVDSLTIIPMESFHGEHH